MTGQRDEGRHNGVARVDHDGGGSSAERDRDADLRDLAAEVGDRAAEARDHAAEARDAEVGEAAGEVELTDRRPAARDRAQAANDRDSARQQRHHARGDRAAAARDRIRADVQRASAEQSAAECQEALAKADAMADYTLLVGQAQGVLMYAWGLDPQQALTTLGSRAARKQIRLADAAHQVISDLMEAKPSFEHDTLAQV